MIQMLNGKKINKQRKTDVIHTALLTCHPSCLLFSSAQQAIHQVNLNTKTPGLCPINQLLVNHFLTWQTSQVRLLVCFVCHILTNLIYLNISSGLLTKRFSALIEILHFFLFLLHQVFREINGKHNKNVANGL